MPPTLLTIGVKFKVSMPAYMKLNIIVECHIQFQELESGSYNYLTIT